MTTRFKNQDGSGIIAEDGLNNATLMATTSVPSDGLRGYAFGCILIKTSGVSEATAIYVNVGSATSCNFDAVDLNLAELALLSGLTSTAAELNRLDDDNAVLATLPGAGITGGTGTVIKTSVLKIGALIHTRIYIDLTGLGTSTTDLDIIGQGVSAAHIGQITAARNGTIEAIRMTCLETPATGADDIDLYAADEATGVFDAGIGTLVETALITSAAAWTNGRVLGSTGVPAANQYLYLTNGEAGTVGTFTAGKFLIELFGY